MPNYLNKCRQPKYKLKIKKKNKIPITVKTHTVKSQYQHEWQLRSRDHNVLSVVVTRRPRKQLIQTSVWLITLSSSSRQLNTVSITKKNSLKSIKWRHMTWPAFITQSKDVNKCRHSLDRSGSRRPNLEQLKLIQLVAQPSTTKREVSCAIILSGKWQSIV